MFLIFVFGWWTVTNASVVFLECCRDGHIVCSVQLAELLPMLTGVSQRPHPPRCAHLRCYHCMERYYHRSLRDEKPHSNHVPCQSRMMSIYLLFIWQFITWCYNLYTYFLLDLDHIVLYFCLKFIVYYPLKICVPHWMKAAVLLNSYVITKFCNQKRTITKINFVFNLLSLEIKHIHSGLFTQDNYW